MLERCAYRYLKESLVLGVLPLVREAFDGISCRKFEHIGVMMSQNTEVEEPSFTTHLGRINGNPDRELRG